jgi:hypothetical protein
VSWHPARHGADIDAKFFTGPSKFYPPVKIFAPLSGAVLKTYSQDAQLSQTLPLFPEAPAPRRVGACRRDDPATSRAAAATAPVSDLEARVLQVLRSHPAGLTTHEISKIADAALVSISPRMRPLANKTLIRDSGGTRRGDNGRKSIVWVVA